MSAESLGAYRSKRNFKKTAEPRGRAKASRAAEMRFVIQKHDASRLHYDFRLEMGGTLKSWAIPKGVPFKKGEKHLAVHVEDHPLEYAGFEGIIPRGQYGGGTVMVWDSGTYEPLGSDPLRDLAAGKLHFALHGKKLDGEWALVRFKHGGDNDWLILKSGADMRPVSQKKDDESSVSGRTMARIARERDADWNSKGNGRNNRAEKLEFIPPMKATLAEKPPAQPGWLYELKFDGYRALAFNDGRIYSSNGKDAARRFPEIAAAVAALPVKSAALDGEIVALDEEGRSSFQLLQSIELGDERPPLAFYIFDLLHLDGKDLRREPLSARRKQLHTLMRKAGEPLRESAEIRGDPRKLLAEVGRRGLEGIMGKLRDSVYEPGRRSHSWIKLKCVHEQELVIGGFTPPKGARHYFGALLVGYYEKEKLKFAGKIGTGFNAAILKSLHAKMRAIERKTTPFSNLPESGQGRWSQNITPGEMKLCTWIKPGLVCQARFTEWTRDGKLRHPVYLGLRDDKEAREVTREQPGK
ncbi:MAG TPA: non-homologous end-joining DNA ligase [Chthoniobacteraceae bacterium]|jgi:bifunctional non-homologous end joining protein LigD|nr:non-homologous end-joining DNA ligase [Chthoniobacteraceae bacterium]